MNIGLNASLDIDKWYHSSTVVLTTTSPWQRHDMYFHFPQLRQIRYVPSTPMSTSNLFWKQGLFRIQGVTMRALTLFSYHLNIPYLPLHWYQFCIPVQKGSLQQHSGSRLRLQRPLRNPRSAPVVRQRLRQRMSPRNGPGANKLATR